MKKQKRFFAVLLAFSLMVSGFSMTAWAHGHGHGGGHHGRCGRDQVCLQEERRSCIHEHREDCYGLQEHCLHVHSRDCYGAFCQGPGDVWSEADLICGHSCSLENGCLTRHLVCRYSDIDK